LSLLCGVWQHESLFDDQLRIDLWPKAIALREKKLAAIRERKVLFSLTRTLIPVAVSTFTLSSSFAGVRRADHGDCQHAAAR
jgi:hypothetical protein